MKTVIFNGSPRPKGDTRQLIDHLTTHLDGTVQEINCYDANIRACIDCRYCWKHEGCAVKDDMQKVYELIAAADNVVIASPMHFSELTGPLLCVTSRFQTYYSAMYIRNEKPFPEPKKGGVMLVGGGNGDPNIPHKTAKHIFHHVNVQGDAPLVVSFDTDNLPAGKDTDALKEVEALAAYLNQNDR